jgi:hypothetical protein
VRCHDALVRGTVAGRADDRRPLVATRDPLLRLSPTLSGQRNDDRIGNAAVN